MIQPSTANKQDDARLDIRAKRFWSREQDVFFDVRVIDPNASSYQGKRPLSQHSIDARGEEEGVW
ncbi:hypothetical protein P5673_030965 [Acropora cervicornis]|uniref:Uncharacterized protein n=1 Tax=Acropora cervicornis TaxID=6130 RepID=A0AAD9PTE8_ACRCE|nr:hypothetical protein P5673_030965 [Acropora cervicornis]